MVNREKAVLLLVLAEIGASICLYIDDTKMPSNRSKIQITIDVASKGEQKGTGEYIDALTEKIKGIKIFNEDIEDGDYKNVEEKEQDANALKAGHSTKQNLDKERKGKKKNERGIKHYKQNENKNERHHLKKKIEEKKRERNQVKGKGKTNNLKPTKTGHRLDRKKTGGKKDGDHDRHRKKSKNYRQRKRVEKIKHAAKIKNFKMKERKGGKSVPNPEGSPKPQDLKIPLTFNREEIGDEGNTSLVDGVKINKNNLNEKINENNPSNQDEANNERKLNKMLRNGNINDGRNPSETGTHWENLSQIKDLTKKIVMATLKEINNMKNTSFAHEMMHKANLNVISNPLMEKLEKASG